MCLEEIQDIELLWQAQQPSIFQAAPAKEDEASLHKHTYRTEEATLRGTITLVGAGLGCPELLTFAAIQALRRAEVVLADELVSREILELATGKVITSGKRQNGQDRGQHFLNQRALRAARKGKFVVRLKSGDPFVFGRGGDEINFFQSHGITVKAIPGLSSALIAPLSANIPVTHRGKSDQILILSAHLRNGAYPSIPAFNPTRTVIFLMVVKRLSNICAMLQSEAIYPSSFPAAVVEKATTKQERVFIGTIHTIADIAKMNKVESPAILVVSASIPVLQKQGKSPLLMTSMPAPTNSSKITGSLPKDEEHTKTVHTPSTQRVPLSGRPGVAFSEQYLKFLNERLQSMSLSEVLLTLHTILPDLWQVTSFGPSGMVIIHHLLKLNIKPNIIFLDTLHHFDETIEHASNVTKTYSLNVHWFRCEKASSKQDFERMYGTQLWKTDPDHYDWLVKVEPLERALRKMEVQAWITGRRRSQGGERKNLEILEYDPSNIGLLKVNPLAYWSYEQVWAYVRSNMLLYNPLHDQGYKSVGDVHSTKPVSFADEEREGRFWHDPCKTECGIHSKNRPVKILA